MGWSSGSCSKAVGGVEALVLVQRRAAHLIKSVLSSIPTFFMFVHVIPTGMATRLEKLQRDFLWDGGGEGFHYHLVSWERICTPEERGEPGSEEVGGVQSCSFGKVVVAVCNGKGALVAEVGGSQVWDG